MKKALLLSLLLLTSVVGCTVDLSELKPPQRSDAGRDGAEDRRPSDERGTGYEVDGFSMTADAATAMPDLPNTVRDAADDPTGFDIPVVAIRPSATWSLSREAATL